jgi:hypothetical protein
MMAANGMSITEQIMPRYPKHRNKKITGIACNNCDTASTMTAMTENIPAIIGV